MAGPIPLNTARRLFRQKLVAFETDKDARPAPDPGPLTTEQVRSAIAGSIKTLRFRNINFGDIDNVSPGGIVAILCERKGDRWHLRIYLRQRNIDHWRLYHFHFLQSGGWRDGKPPSHK